MQIGMAKKGVCLFHLKYSSLFLWIFFCSILWAFPFLCLLAIAIVDSFFLFYLPNIDQLTVLQPFFLVMRTFKIDFLSLITFFFFHNRACTLN